MTQIFQINSQTVALLLLGHQYLLCDNPSRAPEIRLLNLIRLPALHFDRILWNSARDRVWPFEVLR